MDEQYAERIFAIMVVLAATQKALCYNACPTVWKSAEPRPHLPECVAAVEMLRPTGLLDAYTAHVGPTPNTEEE